jgi:OFA family oxalate/formate antiporter-like MFS transporter
MATEPGPSAPRRRRYYGWVIVLVVSIISFAGGVETNPVLGVFQGPMTEEFGWSRVTYTLPMSIGSFVGGVTSLLVGRVMDRRGARLVMTIAIVLMGLTFVLMAAVQAYWQHFILQIIGRTVIASTFFMVVGVVIPKWFVVMRGRAIALANLGQRVGQIAFPVMAERILLTGSWRTGWWAMGVTVWVIALAPTLLLLKRRPEDMGLLPDGVDPEAARAQAETDRRAGRVLAERSFTGRQALRAPAFYLITAAVSIQSFVTTAVHFHWFTYLTGEGVSSAAAVVSLSIAPFVAIPISLVAGVWAERVPVQKVMALSYAIMAGAIALFVVTDTALEAYAFGLAFGVGTGILFTVMQVVWADYFGRESIGVIRGMVAPIHLFGNALGPLVASLFYDVTGNYHLIYAICALLAAVGAALIMLARRPRDTAAA